MKSNNNAYKVGPKLVYDCLILGLIEDFSKHYLAATGRKLNVHETFRRRPGRLLNVLCTFNLRPVSTELAIYSFVRV